MMDLVFGLGEVGAIGAIGAIVAACGFVLGRLSPNGKLLDDLASARNGSVAWEAIAKRYEKDLNQARDNNGNRGSALMVETKLPDARGFRHVNIKDKATGKTLFQSAGRGFRERDMWPAVHRVTGLDFNSGG